MKVVAGMEIKIEGKHKYDNFAVIPVFVSLFLPRDAMRPRY